jgi:N-acetylmuramoyl-L-alanine amidase
MSPRPPLNRAARRRRARREPAPPTPTRLGWRPVAVAVLMILAAAARMLRHTFVAAAVLGLLLALARVQPAHARPPSEPGAPPATVIVIDPGHDRYPNLATEPIGPGSSIRKIKDGGGTHGSVTGQSEASVTLRIGLRLRTLLRAQGIDVVMTRTRTCCVSMGNIARADIANRAHAALFVRIHADGSTNHAVRGTSTLYPALHRGWTDDIYGRSLRAARIVQAREVSALRWPNRGVVARTDITGFNWANVPAILVEVGFLTNPGEDRALAGSAAVDRAAAGLRDGVLRYLTVSRIAFATPRFWMPGATLRAP